MVSYFKGSAGADRPNDVPQRHLSRAVARLDLVYTGTAGQLKYTFHVKTSARSTPVTGAGALLRPAHAAHDDVPIA
jgi:hypothetical protein